MISQEEIREILKELKKDKTVTHVLMVRDTFDNEIYPVAVRKPDSPETLIEKYSQTGTEKVMEVYNMKLKIDAQVDQIRAWNIKGEMAEAVNVTKSAETLCRAFGDTVRSTVKKR